MDDYILRQKIDFSTDFPAMLTQLKEDCQFRKLELSKKIELYDECYNLAKELFLSGGISDEENCDINKTATLHILERARQEWEKALIREGYYDG